MNSLFASFIVLMSATVVSAAPAKLESKFQNGRYVFDTLAETFPDLVEIAADGSKRISIPQLGCSSLNEVVAGVVTTKTDCEAIDSAFKIHRKPATDLFLVLLNQRVAIHSYSSPGVTYIILKDLNCSLGNTSGARPQCSARQGL